MQQKDIEELLKKYHTGKCSPDEVAFLESWYAQWNEKIPVKLTAEELEEDLHLISANVQTLYREAKQVKLWPRIAAAASILLVLSAGGYFLLPKQVPQQQVANNQQHDIAPGRNQATLTLANGQKIVLYKGLSGKLAQQGNTTIQVNGGNTIAYTSGSMEANNKVEYNTMTTKNGEQSPYPLVLADGSKVWLNAASSITFPTAFNGKSREVKITGEAYFEVAHNAARPFRVMSSGQTVEVLGTHFDIKAYEDEPGIKTTLLEGKVRIAKDGQIALLKPGQESITTITGDKILVKNADTETAMAWKNGLFKYQLGDIKTVMRDFARWYDVDIQYEGKIPAKTFTGEIYRDLNASEAL